MPLFGAIPANQNVEVDPVWVGPSAPAGTPDSGDLWWDTDEPVAPYSGQELAYNQITASVTVTATTDAGAQLIVTGTTRTYDGAPVLLHLSIPSIIVPAGSFVVCTLRDGATDLGWFGSAGTTTTTSIYSNASFYRRLTPTAASHTYSAYAWISGTGTGTVQANTGAPGGYGPTFIRVTRV